MSSLFTFTIKSVDQIRDDILRTYRSGMLLRCGIEVDVSPGSEPYQRAEAFARQLAIAMANTAIKADALMPDTCTGEELVRWLSSVGLSKRTAIGAVGSVLLESVANATIEEGRELVDGTGQIFEVLVTGVYANGGAIPVQGVTTGSLTNLVAGSTLRWLSTPANCAETVTVASGGLVGGSDEETDEHARARLLERLATPANSGNWAHVVALAQEASPLVQKAFCYPTLQGPGTVHFAVTAAPTETSKERDLDTAVVSNIVVPYVQGKLPEHVYVVGTTVTNVNVDIAIGLAIPSSPVASTPGPGGGWSDGSPWPVLSSYGSGGATVGTVTTSTRFTVNASTTPVAAFNQIAWLSPTDWKLYTARVTTVHNGSSPWDITIDKPFTGIAAGSYIWPLAENAQTYVDALLEHMAVMGPGEKATTGALLTYSYRRPLNTAEWPFSPAEKMLRAITDAGSEVLDTSFLYRSATSPTASGAGSPPNIFIPRHIGFYPATS